MADNELRRIQQLIDAVKCGEHTADPAMYEEYLRYFHGHGGEQNEESPESPHR